MTKKLFFLLPILLTAFSISAQTRTDKLLKNLHDNESKYIFVIAHRGDWRNAPENSLQSIEKAIAMKVDMIELDIQPTKDGNFICMHDETLDRTSTGKGPIKDYTTEELKKFVLRSGNGIKTRQPIPTLKEALNVCKGRILVNIDKGGTYIKEIMPIIQECGMEKQVIIKGYYPVEKVKKEYGSNESMLYMPDAGGGRACRPFRTQGGVAAGAAAVRLWGNGVRFFRFVREPAGMASHTRAGGRTFGDLVRDAGR